MPTEHSESWVGSSVLDFTQVPAVWTNADTDCTRVRDCMGVETIDITVIAFLSSRNNGSRVSDSDFRLGVSRGTAMTYTRQERAIEVKRHSQHAYAKMTRSSCGVGGKVLPSASESYSSTSIELTRRSSTSCIVTMTSLALQVSHTTWINKTAASAGHGNRRGKTLRGSWACHVSIRI